MCLTTNSASYSIHTTTQVALFASKLISVKDPDTTALAFLSLAREFTNWKFVFVGEGETILKTLDELPSNLEYIPRLLDQATLHELLSKSAIYVNSSLQEGLSLGVIEAAILGNELVLSDAPSNLEILELARANGNSFLRGDVINLQNKLKEKILELESVEMIREDTLRDEFLELCSQNTILSAYENLIKAEFATKEFRSRLNLRKAALTYEE
jgi:glycosyltransferase involved in cell wall biosynthesis